MTQDQHPSNSPSSESALPERVLLGLAFLRRIKQEHLDLLQHILAAERGNLFHVDLIVIAAMNRSLALIDAFITLVEQRNPLAAIPMIRLQIDSVIRLHACWLVESPAIVADALFEDKPLRKIKSSDGKPLTDENLYKAESKHYPWIPEVYRQTSGFVHLSGRHIIAPVTSIDDKIGYLTMFVGPGRVWKDTEMLEAIDAFKEATKSLLHLCWSWLKTKEAGNRPDDPAIP